MQKSRRKYTRFAVPLAVKFRPTYGATDHFTGAARDLSCEGLGLTAHDFRFILYENLDIVIEIPEHSGPVSLSGDIIWKKQDGKRCLAGIKFRMKDRQLMEDRIKKIYASSRIPIDLMYSDDADYTIREPAGNAGVSEPFKHDMFGSYYKLGLTKQYHENGTLCKVTFRLLRDIAQNAEHVTVVGDFNDWDITRSPMVRLKNGDFVITIDLHRKGEYRFRYLLDGHRWENDRYADKFVKNRLGFKESVVVV